MAKNKKYGFTLVELLIVIAIIAVLISILIPVLGRARSIAKRAVCATQLRDIGQGIVMYASEYSDKLPKTSYRTGHRVPIWRLLLTEVFLIRMI